MTNETMKFTVSRYDGSEIECYALLTFDNEETGKHYIVYTDNTTDENGCVRVYASIQEPDEDENKLLPIETEEEWETIEALLEELKSEYSQSEE